MLPATAAGGDGWDCSTGKKALIFGVANDHSIAWGIARALHDAGRDGRLLVGREPDREARPAARGRRSGRPSSSRATSSPTTQIARGLRRAGARPTAGSTSSSTPSPSRGARTSRAASSTRRATGFALALDVSAYSLVALAREARPLLRPRLVDPDADLLRRREGRRQLQRDGRRQGRPRGVGPLPRRRPRARRRPGQRDQRRPDPDAGGGRASRGFKKMYGAFAEVAPLRANITPEDVGADRGLPRARTCRAR